jgi:hypothetical protein
MCRRATAFAAIIVALSGGCTGGVVVTGADEHVPHIGGELAQTRLACPSLTVHPGLPFNPLARDNSTHHRSQCWPWFEGADGVHGTVGAIATLSAGTILRWPRWVAHHPGIVNPGGHDAVPPLPALPLVAHHNAQWLCGGYGGRGADGAVSVLAGSG